MTEPKKHVKRREAPGRMDPQYARDLLEKAREHHNDADDPETAFHAFIPRPKTGEELAEELGEAYLESATTGQPTEAERHERILAEESGGPFITTTASEEFATGTDESNIPEATREPLPRTSKAEP